MKNIGSSVVGLACLLFVIGAIAHFSCNKPHLKPETISPTSAKWSEVDTGQVWIYKNENPFDTFKVEFKILEVKGGWFKAEILKTKNIFSKRDTFLQNENFKLK